MATTPAYDLVIHQFFPAYELQAYCHFAGLSYTIVNSSYPNYSCTGELPQVQHGQMLVSGAKAFAYLKMLGNSSLDEQLTAEQHASLTAFTTTVQTTLHEVLLWCLYADEQQYKRVIGPAIRRAMIAPLRWFVPQALRTRHLSFLASRGMLDEHWVKAQACECYRALATLLAHADGPYLYGQRPCTLDALVYGHLCAVKHLQAGTWVQEVAPALTRFYAHVQRSYFSTDSVHVAVAAVAPGSPRNSFEVLDEAVDKRNAMRNELDKLVQSTQQAAAVESLSATVETTQRVAATAESAGSVAAPAADHGPAAAQAGPFATPLSSLEGAMADVRKADGFNADIIVALSALAVAALALRRL